MIKSIISYVFTKHYYGHIGFNSEVSRKIGLKNKKHMYIGSNVIIFKNSRIEMVTKYCNRDYHPIFTIDDFSQIHQNCHITCAEAIKIGKNVVIVSNVTITDIIHPHVDISNPINRNPIITKPVIIDDECYIYNNVVILPGVKIGKHSIIGANSVVNKSIPQYCIAVGNPAVVIKRYNFDTNIWEKV